METKQKKPKNAAPVENQKLSFAIKNINNVYFDMQLMNIDFDCYQNENNHLEIDMYQFLECFDTDMIAESVINDSFEIDNLNFNENDI